MDQNAFRRILLAYDGSEGADKARELALTLARGGDVPVTVVVAFHALPRVTTPSTDDVEEIHEARALAEKVVQGLRDAGVEAEPDVLEGPAAEAILNAAEARGADLIVIGSRGLSQFKGLLLGSVSDRVIQHAGVPVLVAR